MGRDSGATRECGAGVGVLLEALDELAELERSKEG